MLCGVCLNTCMKYHNIPCGHHACLACTEDYTNQNHVYQCPICLQAYSLEKQPKKAEPPLPINLMLLYCIQCQEAFSFEQMKAGSHRTHTFDHLERFLPLIREKALQRLNKGSIIKNSLLLSAQGQIDEEYRIKIRTLKNEIKSYFQQEKQMLLQRQEKILIEVTLLEERAVIFLQKRRQQLQGLYRQMHCINQTLQDSLDDRIPFETFEILNLLQKPFQLQFLNRIAQVERQTIEIPKFIRPNPLLSTNDSNIFLKYPETPLQESISSQQPQRYTPRRVKLSSKIFRKMICL